MAKSQVLHLVAERKLHEILRLNADERLEASGVYVRDGLAYIVVDNMHAVAIVRADLSDDPGNRYVVLHKGLDGFEDIIYDAASERWFVLVESARDDRGVDRSVVEVYDTTGNHLASQWLDVAFDSRNKGFEGIAIVERNGSTFLLGLCEGNHCTGGKKGRTPGGGRIHVFERDGDGWRNLKIVKLPKWLPFADFASMDVRWPRIAVLSQTSAAVWVGTFEGEGWVLGDGGRVFEFPADADGKMVYCNVEGLHWLGGTRIIVVSDRTKSGEQKARCAAKDQMVHIFDTE